MNDGHDHPLATYRLQFNKEFRFEQAQALVPYLSRLGVTHAYASPVLRARNESTHGYDVVDSSTVHPNLGNETDFRQMVGALQNFGMGLVLDIVPNHMATSIENPYWRDVLTYGPASPFARWFDIDWRMPDPEMWGRVLAPVLGAPLQHVLAADQIRIDWWEGRFLVRYFSHTLPLDPTTVPTICLFGFDELKSRLDPEHPVLKQMLEILGRLQKVPKLAVRVRQHKEISRDEIEQWLSELAQVIAHSPVIQDWAEETAARFGDEPGGRRRLQKLLEAQPYRLVYWRAAARVMNYRRFFDVNELVSVRQEDPQVFDDTHGAIRRWASEGLIDALRIDHIDGLRDPWGYLERLVEAVDHRRPRPVTIFVEKILAHDERLPASWPVAGTTGYDFLNQVEAIFVSPAGFREIEQQYRRFLRRSDSFRDAATWGKRRVLLNDLSPHVGRLADILSRLMRRHYQSTAQVGTSEQGASVESSTLAGDANSSPIALRLAEGRDLSKPKLAAAIVEVVVALPIYRTYIDSRHCFVSEADRRYIEIALAGAQQSGRAAPEALDFLRQVLLLENRGELGDGEIRERVTFIERLQQLAGPAAAKGIEDTALYAYVPLASLSEVAGEPDRPLDDAVNALHRANEDRALMLPRAMLAGTTHDTKRSADVRARLDVLTEMPERWATLLKKWRRRHRPLRARLRGKLSPDDVAENLFYQTVVGIWPAPRPDQVEGTLPDETTLAELQERITHYMLKAAREAKMRTSWVNHNHDYEQALTAFVQQVFQTTHGGNEFLADVQVLVADVARYGFWNSLSRTLIQYTAPGTPDLYNGDELWNFSLVDPDNRRPVDFALRKQLLDEVATAIDGPEESRRQFIGDLVASPEDSRIKLHLIRCALQARRQYPQLFGAGSYISLAGEGQAGEHVFAFARVNGENAAIAVAPRLTAGLATNPRRAPIGESVWGDARLVLPSQLRRQNWSCALTREHVSAEGDGATLALAQVFDRFPAALLIGA